MARLFVDTTPLKTSREFRLLFIGFLVSTVGNQLTLVAIPWQVYHETHSSFQVGLISAAQLMPLICGSLLGGSVGDHMDRRKIMLWTSIALSTTSALLAVNAWVFSSNLAILYGIAMVAAFLAGFSNPSRTAAIPLLVEGEHLQAALAFNQIVLQFGGVIGPLIGAVSIVLIGIPMTYAFDALSFSAVVVTSLMLKPIPPAPGAMRPGLKSIVEGFSFLRGRPILQGVYLVDLNAMVFGLPRALFPAMAITVFHGGPGVLGLLTAAPGIGAFMGAITTGWLVKVRRRGRAISISVAVWGAAMVGFGLTKSLILALLCLGVAGWAVVLSAVLRNTILQTSIPDHFRSRLSAIQIAVVQGGPKLGDLESGAVAALSSTAVSVVSGGLLCMLGVAILAVRRPQFYAEQAPDTA